MHFTQHSLHFTEFLDQLNMDQRKDAPRRYFVDECGRRVLIGLSREETAEFEALNGVCESKYLGADGIHLEGCKRRWSELYDKHNDAWRHWLAQIRHRPAVSGDFSLS